MPTLLCDCSLRDTIIFHIENHAYINAYKNVQSYGMYDSVRGSIIVTRQ